MKHFNLLFLAFAILLSSCTNEDIDDNIDFKAEFSPLEEIAQDSELFELLKQITTDEEQPDLNITCINFNYPLTIFVFDDTDEFVSLNAVLDDEEFITLLNGLTTDYSISVSFPIAATLESGEEFIITTKEELSTSIQNCFDIERVGDCNAFLEDCKFRIGYDEELDNTYLGGIFTEENGLTTLNFNDQEFTGSWTALIIEGQLHININLVDVEQDIEDYFNYDWSVEYLSANALKLTNQDRVLFLNKRCNLELDACSSLFFESCENDLGSEISDHILNDYTPCILDTLDIEVTPDNSFHLTLEDAQNNTNLIPGDVIYNNTENYQSIFVRLTDSNTMTTYFVEIILVSISC